MDIQECYIRVIKKKKKKKKRKKKKKEEGILYKRGTQEVEIHFHKMQVNY